MLYDHLHGIIMRNLGKIDENDRYYNWYHGYTDLLLPYYNKGSLYNPGGFFYEVHSAINSGLISTQYFGAKFDAAKVETDVYFSVRVYPPKSARNNQNVTLRLDFEKVSLKDLSSGGEQLSVERTIMGTSQRSFNYSLSSQRSYYIDFARKVLSADVKKQKLILMPGFRVNWFYSGLEVKPEAEFDNKAFVRNCSKNISVIFILQRK